MQPENGLKTTRRNFLRAATGAAALGLLKLPVTGYGQAVRRTPAAKPAPLPTVPTPWWLEYEKKIARVVDIRSNEALHVTVTDLVVLAEMMDQGLKNLTGQTKVDLAWQSVLGDSKRIVLKFNSVGATTLKTTESVARVLIERLRDSGYGPEKLTLVEAPKHLRKQYGTRVVPRTWGASINIGGNAEQLTTYLHECDAIINVPFLKTHQIAGMTGCMKNLSHALIRHPARYHGDGCSPYVGQVIGNKKVSSKIKLNVMNALRLVVRNGPDAKEEDVAGYGGLLLGYDPLAVDNVGLSLLAMERRRMGLATGFGVRYLSSAAAMKLGRWRPGDVQRIALEVGP